MHTYHYHAPRYYARHRAYQMPDGSTLDALTTRYTFAMFYKPAKGPRGGKARKECARSIYYARGKFWRACNVKGDDGAYYNSVAPFSGTMWDVHAAQSEEQGVPVVRITCVDGNPVTIEMDGEKFDAADEWETFEAVLQLDKKPRKSPKKSDAPANVKSDENDAPAPLVVVIEPATVGGQFALAI